MKVVHRTDTNYDALTTEICDTIVEYSALSPKDVTKVRRKALALSEKALWSHFIKYYHEAYDMALRKAAKRTDK